MKHFLAKTDPQTYSISDLQREKRTVWDGIRNAQALSAIREMRTNDRVFIYHSGGESAVVGLARVLSPPRPDPGDPKLAIVDFEFLQRLEPPATLAEIRGTKRFDGWALIRQSRLSTMPAPPEFVDWMRNRYPKAKI